MEIPEGGYMGKEIIQIAEKIKEEYDDTKLNETTEYFKQYGLKILLKKKVIFFLVYTKNLIIDLKVINLYLIVKIRL